MGDLLFVPLWFGIEIYRLEAGFAIITATDMPSLWGGRAQANELE